MLNPIESIQNLCTQLGLHLCLDCISSIGAMPVDLRQTYLATAVSGKGIGSFPGLSIVFHNYTPQIQPDRLPSYLDLGNWAQNQSIPYTHSSNLLNALNTALESVTEQRMAEIQENMQWLRTALLQCGLQILTPCEDASSCVVTVYSNQPQWVVQLGEELEMRGYWLSFRSSYLQDRNWIQIALLGNPSRADLEKLMKVTRIIFTRIQAQTQITKTT